MADSNKDKTPPKPPKIKLSSTNGNGLPKPKPPTKTGKDTARIDLSSAKTDLSAQRTDLATGKTKHGAPDDTARIELPKPPPKIRTVKSDTAKLDLTAARASGSADSTTRIDVPGAKKSETAKISLDEARPGPDAHPSTFEETQPIAPAEGGKAETYRISLDDAKPIEPALDSEAPTRGLDSVSKEDYEAILKQSTMRVDLTEDPPAEAFSPATSGIDEISAEEREEILKQSTMRVDTDATQEKPPAAPAAHNQTMRVQLDDVSEPPEKGETAKIEIPPVPAADSTQRVGTTRIEMDKEPSSDDVFKRRSPEQAAPGLAAAAGAGAAKMADSAPPQSKTARVDLNAEAEKSKTSRIDVPPDMAAPQSGRPKTIRIKRADSTAGPVQAHVPASAIKKAGKKAGEAGEAAEVGALYSVLAIASVIAMGLLVYVLAAQTVAPTLSWIGKIAL